jgi:hypothetical protein
LKILCSDVTFVFFHLAFSGSTGICLRRCFQVNARRFLRKILLNKLSCNRF